MSSFQPGGVNCLALQARPAAPLSVAWLGCGAVGGRVFSDELDGKRLRFREKDGKIVDRETGSTWNVFGRAVEGPLASKRLEPIEHGVFYAFAWMVFNPDTEIVGAPPAPRSESSIFGEPAQPGVPAGPRAPVPGFPQGQP